MNRPAPPPVRSRITGAPAVLACAACRAVPLLVALGMITGAGTAASPAAGRLRGRSAPVG